MSGAPELFGWLYLPLTPARQAAIKAFEARHGHSVTDVLLTALDDITSNTDQRTTEKTEYLRKFGKGLTRRKAIPITLAGPKS